MTPAEQAEELLIRLKRQAADFTKDNFPRHQGMELVILTAMQIGANTALQLNLEANILEGKS